MPLVHLGEQPRKLAQWYDPMSPEPTKSIGCVRVARERESLPFAVEIGVIVAHDLPTPVARPANDRVDPEVNQHILATHHFHDWPRQGSDAPRRPIKPEANVMNVDSHLYDCDHLPEACMPKSVERRGFRARRLRMQDMAASAPILQRWL